MVLKGTLDEIGLFDLLEMCALSRCSGSIRLVKTHYYGMIYLSDGYPVDALVVKYQDRIIDTVGKAAIEALSNWQNAIFIVLDTPDASDDTIPDAHNVGWQLEQSGDCLIDFSGFGFTSDS
ncbi:MAG: DUF4388 domain-containing protein [Chloroflexaceae bacterium]|nr:DUF4388 domain-containing protein [Chloroflexaceae bacterium]